MINRFKERNDESSLAIVLIGVSQMSRVVSRRKFDNLLETVPKTELFSVEEIDEIQFYH